MSAGRPFLTRARVDPRTNEVLSGGQVQTGEHGSMEMASGSLGDGVVRNVQGELTEGLIRTDQDEMEGHVKSSKAGEDEENVMAEIPKRRTRAVSSIRLTIPATPTILK